MRAVKASAGRSSTSRRRSSGSAAIRSKRSRGESAAIAFHAGCVANGFIVVSSPTSTPIGRQPTCALTSSPAARAARTWSSVSRHSRGARSTCTIRHDSGRPDARAARSSASNSPGPKSEFTSITPAPARFIAAASPRSSRSGADRLPTGRPSAVRCLVVRDVENPSAPAASDASSSSPMRAISPSVGCSRWSAPRSPIT